MRSTIVSLLVGSACALVPTLGQATNGYFSHGVGMKATGMGGAGIAAPQDALSAGSNPAALGFIGNRVDVGLELFRPERESEIAGNMNAPLNAVYDANDEQNFFVPELGFCKDLGGLLSAGIAVYGRGGMNTSYTTPIGLLGTTKAGVDLAQLFVVPAIAVRLGERNALGIGMNFAYQRFKATGLENFTATEPQPYSLHPDKITNNGYASSTGFGFGVGWMGRPLPRLALGASYQSKIHASEFDEYAGLFAGEG
ncbi:MAG: outer membrane protein transport protein, partial [Candidatus Eisenbacteria bacterium]